MNQDMSPEIDRTDLDGGETDEGGSEEHSKRKFQGSAVYSTKYDRRWNEKYPCIQPVKSDPYTVLCTTCLKRLSCKHMGIADVRRHVAGVSHERTAKQMQQQSRLSFPSSKGPLQEKVYMLFSTFTKNFVLPSSLDYPSMLAIVVLNVCFIDYTCRSEIEYPSCPA